MRIFQKPLEAYKEIGRDLWEMGIRVHPQTMQDKVVKDDKDYETVEVRSYCYQISPGWNYNDCIDMMEYAGGNIEYCMAEFKDRISGESLNPGNSYRFMDNVWKEFIHDGKFSYTYSERYTPQLEKLTKELIRNPETRQGIMTMYDYHLDQDNRGGGGRIPCSLLYQFMIREDKLDCIYVMRSCDYLLHFPHDMFMTMMLQEEISKRTMTQVGYFTNFIGSLHAYEKDIKSKGIF